MSDFVKYEHRAVEGEEQLLYHVFKQGYMHVSNFREWVKHQPKSVTFGFTDVVMALPISLTLDRNTPNARRVTIIAPILIKGIVVKSLKDGNPYLGFPQVLGKDKQTWYDVVCPVSAGMRAAMTQVIFDRQDVQQAIAKSIQIAESGAAQLGQPIGNEPAPVAADIELPMSGEESPFAGDEDAAGPLPIAGGGSPVRI